MAQSKFEYVRNFELDDSILKNCWIVIRIDGKGFHKFSSAHNFVKPNDNRALDLMNVCARAVMGEFGDIVMAYGESDEFSFVIRRSSSLYSRRSSKLSSCIVSLFTSHYVWKWSQFFDFPLAYPPAFDARCVVYPTDQNLRDYLSWRQADSHINNLYNTCFWALVQKKNLSCKEAEAQLKGTLSDYKNELLFSEFGINYNNEQPRHRKGSFLFRTTEKVPVLDKRTNSTTLKQKKVIQEVHQDIIGDQFWKERSFLLDP
eukprot:GCRY01001936.1.p1 GENE.GCRY01001936.1~~GCRY01001936.1.p1  ORF type:complete len:259 (+),score=18.90 GCRY01001936.1:169-945(+)